MAMALAFDLCPWCGTIRKQRQLLETRILRNHADVSEKAQIEVYLPDVPRPAYQNLLAALEQELTHTFGGCTTLRGLEGNYLSRLGLTIRDRINLVYTDSTFAFEANFALCG